MIVWELRGSTQTAEKLSRIGIGMPSHIKTTLDAWADELVSYIKSSKLSGDPLHRRSGDLSASVHPVSGLEERGAFGGAAAGAGLPYAKIHEYGGWVPKRVAKNARALAIKLPDGTTIFRKSARGFQMPERSYMRSSLEEQKVSGLEAVKAAVKEYILS